MPRETMSETIERLEARIEELENERAEALAAYGIEEIDEEDGDEEDDEEDGNGAENPITFSYTRGRKRKGDTEYYQS